MHQILFDIDGTLLKTNGAGNRAMERALDDLFGLRKAMQGYHLDGKIDREILAEVLGNHNHGPIEGERRELFFARYTEHFREEMDGDSGLFVYCGAYHLVRRLSGDPRFHLGVGTGNIESCAKEKLRRAGLDSFFSFGGYGSDADDRTGMIRKAISRGKKRYKSEPVSITVIGDTPRDVEHAQNAGARTIAVSTGNYSLEELTASGADLAVETLDPTDRLMAFLQRS